MSKETRNFIGKIVSPDSSIYFTTNEAAGTVFQSKELSPVASYLKGFYNNKVKDNITYELPHDIACYLILGSLHLDLMNSTINELSDDEISALEKMLKQ